MRRSVVFYLMLAFCACSKNPDSDKDAPAVILNTPVNNQVYAAGQGIVIAGVVSDNKFIKEIHIVVSNLATGLEFQHVHIHPNTSSFGYNHSYTAQAGINYKIEVIADDYAANTAAKSVQVSCN